MNSFETARLHAKRLGLDDLAELCVMHKDARVMAALGGVRTDEMTEDYIRANDAHWDRYGFGIWALRDRHGKFAGRSGLRHITIAGVDEVELGYSFAHEFWGRGLATEIAEAVIETGFDRCGLSNIIAFTLVGHIASRNVMEKLGFQFEADRQIKGELCAVYRLHREQGADGL
jgi:RimJ/RimL family protein N-acetyltransferase